MIINKPLIVNFLLFSLGISICFLGPLDRVYDLTNGGVGINKYIRALLLLSLLFFLFKDGLNLMKWGFDFAFSIYVFLFVSFIYAMFSTSITASFDLVLKGALWCLVAVSAYRLRVCGYLTDQYLMRILYIAVILTVMVSLFASFSGNLRTSQNVGAYGILWFVPMLMLLDERYNRWKLFLIGFIFLALVLILKRGAIIAFLLASFASVVVYFFIEKSVVGKLRVILFFIFSLIAISLIVFYNLNALEERFVESGTGRDILFGIIFDNWYYSELENFVLGFGFLSVKSFTLYYFGERELSAHSDILQFLHSFGLVGAFVLFVLYAGLLKIFWAAYRVKHFHAVVMIFTFVCFICINIYSGQLYTPNTIYFGLVVGVVSADINILGENAK